MPCDDNGVASFDLVRHHGANDSVFLYAFDLIELNGDDMRRDPLEVPKATLASIVAQARRGIRFNEHIEGDGPTNGRHVATIDIFPQKVTKLLEDNEPEFSRTGRRLIN
jgi:ATP-dependent DNA ligase